LYYLNVNLVPCFEQTSYQVIYSKIPVASKYLVFVERWFNKSVISVVGNENLSIRLKSTFVMPQSHMTWYLICNVVFDGLQNFIKKNLPTKYNRSCQELDYIRFNTWEESARFVSPTPLQVFCVRYVDDVLILGKCLKMHAKSIQCLFVNFLNKRGLTIKDPLVFQGKLFAPGSSIKYLGFMLIYPNFNKFKFNTRRDTSLKRAPVSVGKMFFRYPRFSPYVLIQARCLKNLKNILKGQLSRKNSCLDVSRMIDCINIILKQSLGYCNISFMPKKQFSSLNDLLHKLFYKYLFRKYSSVPKIYSYIKTNFRNQGKFTVRSKVLFKTTNIV
jgi:hypothetical protein